MDMVGLICHINLLAFVWMLVWHIVKAVINFNKGDQRVCSSHYENQTLAWSWKRDLAKKCKRIKVDFVLKAELLSDILIIKKIKENSGTMHLF